MRVTRSVIRLVALFGLACAAGEALSVDLMHVYREALTRLFVLDPLEAWIPAFSPLKRLTVTPKHHLVDPRFAPVG